MALKIAGRVKETTTTSGTGTYTLDGAAEGFQDFSVIGDGNTCYYACVDADNYEIGIGTYTASGTTLARTTILESSNSGNAVSWPSGGERNVFVTMPADKVAFHDGSDNLSVKGSVDLKVQSSHASHNEGRLWYDSIHKTLNYYSDEADVVHEIGLEEHVRVYNNTGSTITKGKSCYFAGNKTENSTVVPTIAMANATSSSKYKAEGMTAHDIENNSYGYLIVSGRLEGIDTSALSQTGQFFTGLTDGSIQSMPPDYPNFPMCMGFAVKLDATNGVVLIAQQNHSIKNFRVQMDQHIGGDLTIDGDLNVTGTTTTTSTEDVTAGAPFYRANEGDAIGEAGTTFSGTGLDDAFFSGHFTGTTSTSYYVKIDGTSGAADTFAVSTDNFATTLTSGTAITGDKQLIHSADNIYVEFGATTGHTLNDQWTGTASPINVDTGFWSNRNTGSTGVGYTHMGLWYDSSDSKWNLTDEYDPTPAGTINKSHASYVKGTLIADLEGDVTGDVTGNVSGDVTGDLTGNADTATALATSRNIALTGSVTGSASFDGSADASIATSLTAADVLTAVKTVDGASSGLDADLLDGQEGSYYSNYNNLSNKPTIPAAFSFSGVIYGAWVNSGQSAVNSGYWGFVAMDDNSWPCMYVQRSTYTGGTPDVPQTFYRFRKVYRTYG